MTGASPPTLVLGIDPGTRVTGWGVVSAGGPEPRGIAFGVIAPKAGWPVERRLLHIFEELRDVIARFAPATVAVEEPFVGANVRSAMAVGEARTVAILAAGLAGVPVRSYAPARIKQIVAGYGLGDKAQVREMLRLQLGMNEMPDDLNASDALAVALCHAVQLRAEALVEAAEASAARKL